MRSLNSISHKLFILFAILSSKKPAGCNPITNSNLNDHIREISLKEDNINSTRIKTLQKEEPGRYANFAPARSPIRFKDSDSALSSSSYSRGPHHEHPGYTIHEYDDSPHLYGYEEYHIPGPGQDHQVYDHHIPTIDHYHGHHDTRYHIGHHHKHYDHALAAKTILWPIAGIALLGAAAALVSNPILLQLGVVSGKRRRRDTEENFGSSIDSEELNWLNKKLEIERSHLNSTEIDRLTEEQDKLELNKRTLLNEKMRHHNNNVKNIVPKKVNLNEKQEALFKKVYPTVQLTGDNALNIKKRYFVSKEINENKLVPVPLILKKIP